jgi:hypothetical protein
MMLKYLCSDCARGKSKNSRSLHDEKLLSNAARDVVTSWNNGTSTDGLRQSSLKAIQRQRSLDLSMTL